MDDATDPDPTALQTAGGKPALSRGPGDRRIPAADALAHRKAVRKTVSGG
ncbi:hypothetical protein ABZY42_19730 [Streptomyces sp. NPDC006622]